MTMNSPETALLEELKKLYAEIDQYAKNDLQNPYNSKDGHTTKLAFQILLFSLKNLISVPPVSIKFLLPSYKKNIQNLTPCDDYKYKFFKDSALNLINQLEGTTMVLNMPPNNFCMADETHTDGNFSQKPNIFTALLKNDSTKNFKSSFDETAPPKNENFQPQNFDLQKLLRSFSFSGNFPTGNFCQNPPPLAAPKISPQKAKKTPQIFKDLANFNEFSSCEKIRVKKRLYKINGEIEVTYWNLETNEIFTKIYKNENEISIQRPNRKSLESNISVEDPLLVKKLTKEFEKENFENFNGQQKFYLKRGPENAKKTGKILSFKRDHACCDNNNCSVQGASQAPLFMERPGPQNENFCTPPVKRADAEISNSFYCTPNQNMQKATLHMSNRNNHFSNKNIVNVRNMQNPLFCTPDTKQTPPAHSGKYLYVKPFQKGENFDHQNFQFDSRGLPVHRARPFGQFLDGVSVLSELPKFSNTNEFYREILAQNCENSQNDIGKITRLNFDISSQNLKSEFFEENQNEQEISKFIKKSNFQFIDNKIEEISFNLKINAENEKTLLKEAQNFKTEIEEKFENLLNFKRDKILNGFCPNLIKRGSLQSFFSTKDTAEENLKNETEKDEKNLSSIDLDLSVVDEKVQKIIQKDRVVTAASSKIFEN